MKLKIGENEYSIKFAYKPTLKERLISRIVKTSMASSGDEVENMERVEDLLLFLPEILLVGLQAHHKDEYGYDYDTRGGKEEQLDRTCKLVEQYCDKEDGDLMELYEKLEEAMLQDGFLKSLFQKEQKKQEQIEMTAASMATDAVQSEN